MTDGNAASSFSGFSWLHWFHCAIARSTGWKPWTNGAARVAVARMPAIRAKTTQTATDAASVPFDVASAFPGRTALYAWEAASFTGCAEQQIVNFIDEGELLAVDVGGKTAKRRSWRIPVSALQAFVDKRRSA